MNYLLVKTGVLVGIGFLEAIWRNKNISAFDSDTGKIVSASLFTKTKDTLKSAPQTICISTICSLTGPGAADIFLPKNAGPYAEIAISAIMGGAAKYFWYSGFTLNSKAIVPTLLGGAGAAALTYINHNDYDAIKSENIELNPEL